jgi:AraC family transcriptional activator of tynA and feaB
VFSPHLSALSRQELKMTAAKKAKAKGVVEVWDTSYVPSSQAFSFFREGVCNSFLPWTSESIGDQGFRARLESVSFENGLIGRIRSTPARATRTNGNIADSKAAFVYASLRLFGDASVEQGRRSVIAHAGDLVIFDSTRPTTYISLDKSASDAIALLIPKWALPSSVRDVSSPFLIPKAQIIEPFSSCFGFITRNMYFSSKTELNGLFDACVALLPIAKNCYTDNAEFSSTVQLESRALHEIFAFIDDNIANQELSAQYTAKRFNISERYVHKLMSKSGIRFSAYVTRKRLEHISADLINPALRRKPIAHIAYHWGFLDLSTFNRSFRVLYNCSPRQYRTLIR